MNARVVNAVIMIILLAVVSVAGIGIGWSFGTTVPHPKPKSASSAATSSFTQAIGNGSAVEPYSLTLIEAMMVPWNSTIMQPKFYVLGSHGLESSANISLPANRLIEVTIFSYDTPTPNVTASAAKVEGTVRGTMFFYNGTVATGFANETMRQMMSLGANVTSVPVGSVAHTFSVPQLGINIPVVGGSTEIAYLEFNQAGTFTWQCMTPCGFGPNSGGGAMSTPGWMTGIITVH